MSQSIVLLLAHDKNITMTDTAKALNTSPASASKILKRLTCSQYLTAADPDSKINDNRMRPYTLTDQTKEMLKKAFGRNNH